MRFIFASLFVTGAFLLAMITVARAELDGYSAAKLKVLDKITARTKSVDLQLNETIEYGPLLVTLRTCRKAPPIETPRTVAFLEIIEQDDIDLVPQSSHSETQKPKTAPQKTNLNTKSATAPWSPSQPTSGKPVFSGWMFASSPALSSMDHPVYDVWVIDCVGDKLDAAELTRRTNPSDVEDHQNQSIQTPAPHQPPQEKRSLEADLHKPLSPIDPAPTNQPAEDKFNIHELFKETNGQ